MYDGTAKTPELKVVSGNTVLEKDKDYSVTYGSNVEIGTVSVNVAGIGNYSGNKTLYFEIDGVKEGLGFYFADGAVSVNAATGRAESVYSGEKQMPKVIVTYDGKLLKAGVDYTIKYSNNLNVDKKGRPAKAEIKLVTPVKEKKMLEFFLTAKALGNADFTPAEGIDMEQLVAAPGKKIKPVIGLGTYVLKAKDVKITSSTGKLKFKEGEDATLTIEAKSANFSGKIVAPVRIMSAKDIKAAAIKVTVDKKAKKTYSGTAQILTAGTELKVATASSNSLTEGVDYTVSYYHNENAGTATVVVRGLGPNLGRVTKKFKIAAAKKADIEVKVLKDSVLAESGAKPVLSVTDKTNNRELIEGIDYKLKCSRNKKAGTGCFTISYTGNYKGHKAEKKQAFNILEK